MDFEFNQPAGESPDPLCMVALEYHTGAIIRLWRDDLRLRREPPFEVGDSSLFVAYYASAELSCFLSLGWGFPSRILDLYAEFRNLRSGLSAPSGFSLLGCLSAYGLPSIDSADKESMRALAMRGGDYTPDEVVSLLDYCQSDVVALRGLLPQMLDRIHIGQAVCRGRYMGAVARMERCGVPIDTGRLERLRARWEEIQDGLVSEVDRDYGVYVGRSFKADRFAAWLVAQDIAWPCLDGGALDLSEKTFREMALAYPDVSLLHQLRVNLSQLRLNALEVGHDGRNRTLLSPFKSKTGRNQPSNAKFIFGPARWLRGLIRPEPGRAVAYVDWSQQEFGIAAALSGDTAMQAAYASGDPYLAFGKQAGMIPPDGVKKTHKKERELCKACILGVQYGMGDVSLARRIGKAPIFARELLRLHRETYRTFWMWSDAVQDTAMLRGHLSTVWGWRVHLGDDPNARSLRNFPMQANGAEMLRLACCKATEAGIGVCAPVHDAMLIEAAADDIDKVVIDCQEHMTESSKAVLGGFPLRSDASVVRYPDRYEDEGGVDMWNMVWGLVDDHR